MAHEPDILLAALVASAESKGFEVNVTLWVAGALVTGVLTNAQTFLRGVAEIIDAHPAGLGLADTFRGSAATLEDVAHEHDVELSGRPLIHLREAKTWFANQQISPLGGFYWRGLLSAVGAWTLGEMRDLALVERERAEFHAGIGALIDGARPAT
jgi:hypothetical protein